jgi:PAS domain S-box-containing protein
MFYPDLYLNAIVELQSMMLADNDTVETYQNTAKLLGETVGCDRVCVYDKRVIDSETSEAKLKAQWAKGDFQPITEGHILHTISTNNLLRGWLKPLRAGIIISGHLKDFDEQWLFLLKDKGLSSFSYLPIISQNKLVSIIALYHCQESHTPTPTEINLFNVVGNQLSNFLNRKYTENKLLSYKRIFEESNFSVFVLNSEGYHIESNYTYRRLVGYDNDEELGDVTPEILFGSAYHTWFAELHEKGFYEGEITIAELDIVLAVSSYAIQADDGQFVCYVNIANDITDRIEREKEMQNILASYQKLNEDLVSNEYELLKSKDQLRMLAENSFEMVSLSTPDGTIVYISPSAEKVTGHRKEEMQGKSLIEFFHPDDLDIIQIQSQSQLNKGAANKDIVITHRFQLKSGNYIWLESFIKYLYDEEGNVANLQTSSRDITQSVEANAALQASEEKFRTLFNKTYDSIFIYRVQGAKNLKIAEVNEVACKLLGYTREELLDMNFYELFAITADFPELDAKNNFYFQATLCDKKNKRIPVEVAITLIQDEETKLVQAVVRDITEKQKAEENLKAKSLAEKLLKVKSDFLANMSHEIRTPMNGILGMTHFLLDSNLTEKQLHYVQTVKKSSENLLMILNDILDFSKLEAGKMKLKPTTFNIKQTAKQLNGLFESVALQKNIRIHEIWDFGVPEWVHGDESRMMQVMTNLLSNAIKFTPQGKVICRFLMENMHDYQGFVLKVEVIDSGIGISAENQALLFDKFYQIESSNSIKQQGTGLGLSICRQLVQLWGGEIGVESKEGKGSCFWFTIPLRVATDLQMEAVKIKPIASNQKLKFKNLNILLAEDVFVNQEVAKTMAENLGCIVEVVENGKEAVHAATHNHYDLILMDIQMPIMSGITATQFIKRGTKNPPLIIGLSANAMEEDAKKYISLGMDDYLSKPIEPNTLQEKLAHWFPHKIQQNESQYLENQANNLIVNAIEVQQKEVRYPQIGSEKIENDKNEIDKNTILNLTSINKILSLVKNNKASFEVLTNSFAADMQALLQSAKTAANTQDYKQLVSDMHTIKGVAGTIGTTALYEDAKILYTALKENDFEDLENKLQKMELLYQEANAALTKVAEEIGS